MSYIDKKFYDKFPKNQLDELEKDIKNRANEILKENEKTTKECFEFWTNDLLEDSLLDLEEREAEKEVVIDVEIIEECVFNY